ncbi:MAG TPA: VWA domain-containing protein, partial [Pyrinomonadaceae bacterium]|nr:VWA domain-containing protein [Pyrinomonadaceae bacterium]
MKHFSPFLLIALAGSIIAQQVGTLPPPPGQKPDDLDVVKITTNLVQVDAVVTDKNGKLVTDLKPEEVQIFEDNRPQKITHFLFSSSPAAGERRAEPTNTNKTIDPAAPSAPPTAITRNDVRRSIAVVVDDLGMSFESVAYVRRALAKFVAEQMQPGDLVSIIRTGGGTGALQQFTTDKRRLSAAIEQVKFNLMGRGDVSAFAPLKAPDLKIPDEAESRNQTAENFRAEAYSVGTLGTLRYVVQGLR